MSSIKKYRQTTLKRTFNDASPDQLALDVEKSPDGNRLTTKGAWVSGIEKYFEFKYSTKGQGGRLFCTMICKLCGLSNKDKDKPISITDKSSFAFVRHLKVNCKFNIHDCTYRYTESTTRNKTKKNILMLWLLRSDMRWNTRT